MDIKTLFKPQTIKTDFYAFKEDLKFLDDTIQEINDSGKYERVIRSDVFDFFLTKIVDYIVQWKRHYKNTLYEKDIKHFDGRHAAHVIYQDRLKKKGLVKQKFRVCLSNIEAFEELAEETADLGKMLNRQIGTSALLLTFIRPMAEALKEYYEYGEEITSSDRWDTLNFKKYYQEDYN